MVMENCPVCHKGLINIKPDGFKDAVQMDCPRCGTYVVSDTLYTMLQHGREWNEYRAAAMSHAIRRMQLSVKIPELTSDVFMQLEKEAVVPRPAEQANHLVLWLGDTARFSGRFIDVDMIALEAIVGAVDALGTAFVIDVLKEKGLVHEKTPGPGQFRLTIKGWDEYERLRLGRSDSRRALMAMSFHNDGLLAFFNEHLKPAVRATGYTLFKLDERPKAGSIDNRLRVEIRESRFLVADLSDVNAGSYWEAGFAEGLGKPVIYLCHQKEFEERGTHFDTNHSHTIKWCENDPAAAVKELKATIRATLPGEAIMTDEEKAPGSAT